MHKRHLWEDNPWSYIRGLWVLIGLLCLLCSCSSPLGQFRDGPVLFRYVDEDAKKVCIAGSFNQWSPSSHCMGRSKSTWTLPLVLPRGRYPYLFVIDDYIWKPDPGAILWEESGFGTKNSILIVE